MAIRPRRRRCAPSEWTCTSGFFEVSVSEGGRTGRIGRVEIADLETFADSLAPYDHVVIESTSVSWAVVDVLGRRAGRVTVSNPMKTKAIASAKVKTDKVDARVLAELGASGFVSEVWVPDAQVRSLRRRVAHRARLVRQRTRLRNHVHAVLTRNLRARDGSFGKQGRAELAGAALPEHERYELDAFFVTLAGAGVMLADPIGDQVAGFQKNVPGLITRPTPRSGACSGEPWGTPSPAALAGAGVGAPGLRPVGDPARRAGPRQRQATPIAAHAGAELRTEVAASP